jgi:hypothetical protein
MREHYHRLWDMEVKERAEEQEGWDLELSLGWTEISIFWDVRWYGQDILLI